MTIRTKFFPDHYVDSVVQLRGMRAMREVDRVDWAGAGLATATNLETLRGEGVDAAELEGRGANDFFLAVRAEDEDAVAEALRIGESAVFTAPETPSGDAPRRPGTVAEALRLDPDANLAVVSVPGDYAGLAAYQCLSAGLHVLLFSDNVSLDTEVALKTYAASRGLFVMGPGAGTAHVTGAALGFANVVDAGRVGIVAAAGTGAQEAMVLLSQWGVGVRHVIGLGGRDVTAEVGGTMAAQALATLREDSETDLILLVSKPPDLDVAAHVLAAADGKPVVAALVGLTAASEIPEGVIVRDTLEAGVVAAVRALGHEVPDLTELWGPDVGRVIDRLDDNRTRVVGLFSGGTLCAESLVILGKVLGEVHSNVAINPDWGMPAPDGAHVSLDLGEEEYTRGRPHPMIDPEARIDLMREMATDSSVAVLLLDVVLGHGAHADPASVLAPVCAEVMADDGPQVVVYVLGTEDDPQGLSAQREAFAAAGCIVAPTCARADLVAAAIARRDQEILAVEL